MVSIDSLSPPTVPPTYQDECLSSSEDEHEPSMLSLARNNSLMDFDDHSSPSTSLESPRSSRKRRATELPHRTGGWEDFCRKGTRFKSFLDDALTKVVTDGLNDASPVVTLTPSKPPRFSHAGNDHHSAAIARQKTADCLLLQKQLEQAKQEAVQAHAANTELRQAAAGAAQRMERTTHALRIAGQNAANARTDADAAEVTAATLATQLQAFQEVVEETKRASQVLYQEHEQVAAAAQSVETKWVQTEAELARSQSQRQALQKQADELTTNTQRLEQNLQLLKIQFANQASETKQWKQSANEVKALDHAQKQRMDRVECELQHAQSMLVEATSTAAEAEATASVLKDTIEQLKSANSTLHEKIQDQQTQARTEQENLSQTLQKAQQEGQTLRMEAGVAEDQIQKLSLDKAANEKRVGQLQSRATNLERRLKDSSNSSWNIATPDASDAAKSPSFTIPSLGGGKENAPMPATKCSICFKDAVGIMKKCQCGTKECECRARAICVNKIKAWCCVPIHWPGPPTKNHRRIRQPP
jgi:chromosome segregation ATPase